MINNVKSFPPEWNEFDSNNFGKYGGDALNDKQDTLIQSGAAVGQIAKITAVDSNGKPTAWQAVDMPSGGGSVPTGGVTTLHINITDVNRETIEATFTADKTPSEMRQASANGPIWCVMSFQAGVMAEDAISIGIPPAWVGGEMVFGGMCSIKHGVNGDNENIFTVSQGLSNTWIVNLTAFGS